MTKIRNRKGAQTQNSTTSAPSSGSASLRTNPTSTSVPNTLSPNSMPIDPSSTSTPVEERPPRIRIAPHIADVRQSLYFDVVDKEVPEGTVLKVGRFTDKVSLQPNRIAFKSKVVSRSHAEIWTETGTFFLKDTKSSSGTFLNQRRLSPPGQESSPYPLKDGDVIQLGVDYQGGTQDIYKCVRMRVEINRDLQREANNPFRKQMIKKLKNISKLVSELAGHDGGDQSSGECCICLYKMRPMQSLFVAPCAHCFHFKCIKPVVFAATGFICPLCRTYADLEETVTVDVETDEEDEEDEDEDDDDVELDDDSAEETKVLSNPSASLAVSHDGSNAAAITGSVPVFVELEASMSANTSISTDQNGEAGQNGRHTFSHMNTSSQSAIESLLVNSSHSHQFSSKIPNSVLRDIYLYHLALEHLLHVSGFEYALDESIAGVLLPYWNELRRKGELQPPRVGYPIDVDSLLEGRNVILNKSPESSGFSTDMGNIEALGWVSQPDLAPHSESMEGSGESLPSLEVIDLTVGQTHNNEPHSRHSETSLSVSADVVNSDTDSVALTERQASPIQDPSIPYDDALNDDVVLAQLQRSVNVASDQDAGMDSTPGVIKSPIRASDPNMTTVGQSNGFMLTEDEVVEQN